MLGRKEYLFFLKQKEESYKINKMVHQKRAIFALFLIPIILFIHSDSNSIENSKNLVSDNRFLVIIDFGFLSCPLCVQSFTEFNDAVNRNGLEQSTLGVLIFNGEEKGVDLDRYTKIVKKRLRGFVTANDIKFPFILDRDGVFKDLSLGEPILILFDSQNERIKKYKFPISRFQINKIFKVKKGAGYFSSSRRYCYASVIMASIHGRKVACPFFYFMVLIYL